jgi:hypothetical protein
LLLGCLLGLELRRVGSGKQLTSVEQGRPNYLLTNTRRGSREPR